MQTKSFDLQIKEAREDAPGIVAYASTFDRIPDAYGDVVAKGAFTGTLKRLAENGYNLPLLYGHVMDNPSNIIGTVTKAAEDEHGLLVEATFDMENPAAVQVRRAILAKAINKLSFAFSVLDAEPVKLDDGTQVRELTELEIYEVSIVVVPANPRAAVVSAKDAEPEQKMSEETLAVDTAEEPETETEPEVKTEEPIGAKAEEPTAEEKAEEPEAPEPVNPVSEKENIMDIETMNTIGAAAPQEKGMKEIISETLSRKGSGRFSVATPEIKSAGPIFSVPEYTQSRNVGLPTGRLGIVDLCGYEAISGNVYTFVQIGPKDGAFDEVAEGDEKPLVDYTDTMKTLPLTKVAAIIKETDELVEDNDYVVRAIETRGIYDLKRKVEFIVLGDILGATGIGTETYPNGGDMDEAVLLAAIGDVMTNSGYAADGIILNPQDYAALVAASLSNPRTLFGPDYTTFMGIPIVQSDQQTQGSALVGCFKQCATLVTKGGIRVEFANQNEDDFIHNLVAIRIEQRFVPAVRVPSAFVVVEEAE